jgi:ribonucleoside-diphosphate reductase alpha chain
MMDCDTTGIEPDIALIKFKQLAGGGTLKIVNQTVPLALRTLGYTQEEIERIQQYIEENRTIDGAKDLLPEHLPVFDCAFPAPGSDRCIGWQAHLKMMSAAQPFISGAISKTVNMPNSATKKDIADAYMLGWELGLKAVAVYRDGSKTAQPLSTSNEKEDAKEEKTEKPKKIISGPRREHLPDTRQSITHKFQIAGHEGYITVGLYHDGRPGELFITMAKEGSTIGGLMDCFSTALSMSLQYGVPLSAYVKKFSHTRFEPMGFTKNPDIPIAKSVVDYIFRWLGQTFFDAEGNAILRTSPDFLTHNRKTPAIASDSTSPNTASSSNAVSTPSSVASSSVTSSNTVSSNAALLSVASSSNVQASTIESAPRDHLALSPPKPTDGLNTISTVTAEFQSDAPACDNCGAITVRSGNCYLCYNCGKSLGCS